MASKNIPRTPDTVPGSAQDTIQLQVVRLKALQSMANPIEQRTWEQCYLKFSYSEPVVWHSLLAIASLIEGYTLRANPKAAVAHQLTLWHYNKAIRLLTPQKSEKMVSTEVLLSACYLFFALESILQNTDAAIAHLWGGFQIIRTWKANHTDPNSFVETIFRPVFYTTTFNWLANAFLYGIRLELKMDMIDLCLPPKKSFNGMADASVELFQITCYGLGSARSFEKYKVTYDTQENDGAAILQREYFRAALEKWLGTFEELYPQDYVDTVSIGKAREIKYLTLVARILYLYLPGRFNVVETRYDAYAKEFASIVDQIISIYNKSAKVFEKHQKANQTAYYFQEHVFIHMYMIAIKCRNPAVRRKALSLLETSAQQSIWNNRLTIKVVERVIQIEEEGLEDLVDAMGDVVPSEWARIHDISPVPENSPHPEGPLFRMRQRIDGKWCIRDERPYAEFVPESVVLEPFNDDDEIEELEDDHGEVGNKK